MKKIGILLVIVLGLGLAACGAAQPASTAPTVPPVNSTPLPPQVDAAAIQTAAIQEQIEAAAAQTRAAVPIRQLSDQEIQTAIALTQPVAPIQTATPPTIIPASSEDVDAKAMIDDPEIQAIIAQFSLDDPDPKESSADAVAVAATYTPDVVELRNVSADEAFSGASIKHWGLLRHKEYMITLQLTSATTGNFYGLLGKTKYKCFLLPKRTDRLFCYGGNVHGGNMKFTVFEETSNRQLFIGDVVLPQWTPTHRPSATPTIIIVKNKK